MRSSLIASVLTALLALAPAAALAGDYGDDPGDDTDIQAANPDATLDLGVDVSDVPHTAAAVKAFIGQMEPATQSAIMGACETYMKDPASASSPDTIGFCASAVRG